MGAFTYSGTAGSNTAVDGIGSQGSDSPDNIDNLVRALAASDANLVRDLGGANTSVGGSANAITVSLADATTATAYFDGMRFSFRAGSDNSIADPTLSVDGIGTKKIRKAVAGVETALVAGDIQAGATCEVIYRSAWDTAAGAFELLNPDLANTYQPLDADLTAIAALTTAAAGRSVLSLADPNADRIVFWDDSAGAMALLTAGDGLTISGTTITAAKTTFATAQSATGTAIDFSSIPSGVREIFVGFDQVSMSGADTLLVQIGPSGTPETTSYQSVSTNAQSSGTSNSTAGFAVRVFSGSDQINGVMSITNLTGNVWVASHALGIDTGAGMVGGGRKSVASAPDILRVTRAGSATFDAGQLNVWYR